MKNCVRNFVVAASAAAWMLTTTANATTVVPPTFEELADRADLVLVAKVSGSQAEWRTVETNRVIFTLVQFETHEVLKGNAPASVTLEFLGGTVGEATLEVEGVPTFPAGERVILFVEKNGVQFCPLVGVYHGKFGLGKEENTGRDIVLMHDGKPLRDVAEIGTGDGAEFGPQRPTPSIAADRKPMSVDDFKSKIRAHLTERAARN